MQHQYQLTARSIETGLKDMHLKAVDLVNEPRADARRQDSVFERFHWLVLAQRDGQTGSVNRSEVFLYFLSGRVNRRDRRPTGLVGLQSRAPIEATVVRRQKRLMMPGGQGALGSRTSSVTTGLNT